MDLQGFTKRVRSALSIQKDVVTVHNLGARSTFSLKSNLSYFMYYVPFKIRVMTKQTKLTDLEFFI